MQATQTQAYVSEATLYTAIELSARSWKFQPRFFFALARCTHRGYAPRAGSRSYKQSQRCWRAVFSSWAVAQRMHSVV